MNNRALKVNLYAHFTIYVFIQILLIQSALSNNCISKQTCGECIAESPLCSWCWKEEMDVSKLENDGPMCDYKENLQKRHCKNIIDLKNSIILIKDDPLSNKVAREDEAIQIKPQEIRIKLRPNSVQKFKVQFRQAVDYPVDLYYLMDLSKSMDDDKDKLAELGDKLAREMGKITSNFRLGFGSFVDKTVAPYVSSHEDKLKEPCNGCAAPYGYKNNMPLTNETAKFAKKVKEAPISGNLDAPEGGFDAIMQAIVCTKEIGWRNKSRKLLVYSSDNSYHYAGDGKLGGIIAPNDETCHLDGEGKYTKSTELDYPSLSQINRQIREHKVNIIFAVTQDQSDLYEHLSKRLVGSSTGTLDADSANVVDLVRQQYEKIRSSVEMTHDVGDNNIKVTYKSKCLGSELEKTNICKGLKVENTVTFDVEVEYTFCPKNKKLWNITFPIYPVGLQDYLTVHLEMICECDCEKPENEERDSPKCSGGHGTFECGVCNCNPNRYGKECECDANESDPFLEQSGCIKVNDTKPCSGVGFCHCGQCRCYRRPNPEEIYYGKFCECNNFSCDKHDGKVCSGPDHGVCVCGMCKCHQGWTGDDCSCRDGIEECLDDNGKICSGHGSCECGSCVCSEAGEQVYFGKYCDDCATCPGKCNELKKHVECWLKNQHDSNLTCPYSDFIITPVDDIKASENERQCTFEDEDGCRFTFKYKFGWDNMLLVEVKTSKDCPEPVPVVAIVSGVSGGVVATGLFLLMLWKILTTIHDRRELAKFEKERLKAKWNEGQNPIYKEATTTFQNPAYRGD